MAAITATERWARSAAIADSRSYRKLAQRYSILTFFPSTKLISPKPLRNAARKGVASRFRRPGAEIANDRQYRLLCVCHERPRRRASKKCNELASFHCAPQAPSVRIVSAQASRSRLCPSARFISAAIVDDDDARSDGF